MAIVATDWSITRATGVVEYTGNDHGGGSPSYATVIQFHRWLMDLADDAEFIAANADELDIVDQTPSDRSTDNIITLLNGFTLGTAAPEHLYDGSIIEGGGTDVWDGIVNFGNADVQIQIHQDGAVLSDDWWNFAGAGLNPDATAGISHRFMLKTRTAGADIDNRKLLGTTRTFNNTYAEFTISAAANGNNVLALVDSGDLNNTTAEATVATWTGITNTTEGYALIDVNNDTTDEAYYSEWNTNQPTRSINDFYERMKWLTRDGSASTLYGLNGELFRGITHQLDVDGGAGTFTATPEHEVISWGSGATAGTARLFAVDDKTASATTLIWFQMLTGVTPADNLTITGGTSSATVDADLTTGALTPRTISTPFVGVSTGSALIGSYGFGVEKADLGVADTVFDLTNTDIHPPNNVSFAVGGVVSGEDRILVTNNNAGDIDFTQMATDTLLNGAAETSVSINPAPGIPADTPAPSGTIRIERDNGLYSRHPYSAVDVGTDTFTITAHDFSTNNAAATNNVFISYIDLLATSTEESFTTVYDSDRTLFVRVRDGGTAGDAQGIKTAETTGVLGTNGGSVTINRIDDF